MATADKMRDDAWKWSMYRETCKSFIFCKILCVCKFTHDIIFKLLWIQITVNEADVLKSTKITIHKIWMIYIKTLLWNLSTFSTVMGTSLCRKSLWYKKKKNVVFLLKKKKKFKNEFIYNVFFLSTLPSMKIFSSILYVLQNISDDFLFSPIQKVIILWPTALIFSVHLSSIVQCVGQGRQLGD